MIEAMNLRIALLSSLFFASIGALAEEVKVPLNNGEDQGTVYVAPNVSPTEKSADVNGATVGMQKPDGQAVYGGVDTSSALPTYSAGVATGGDVSFTAGASSDGKTKNEVKAGVTIKY
jgi:hypothetical protein